jgi:hypothetical protein
LDIAWPQHDPTKGAENPKIPRDISEVNVDVMVKNYSLHF